MVQDPNILLSVINTYLRDRYDSLDSLCSDLDYDIDSVNEILNKNGYFYDKDNNKFVFHESVIK